METNNRAPYNLDEGVASGLNLESEKSQLLLNPRLPMEEREFFLNLWQDNPFPKDHFGVTTSGSMGRPKIVLLSRDALLASAAAVNEHLLATGEDIWALALPKFHVGGLSVYFRAELRKAKVKEFALTWDAFKYVEFLKKGKITLTSLVSTQVFDLVAARLSPPASLRAVVVGGGRLDHDLYHKGRALGWPLLPSYGMSECASQVATATLESLQVAAAVPAKAALADSLAISQPIPLKVLSHIDIRSGPDNLLEIRSPALFSGYLVESPDSGSGLGNFIDPKDGAGYFRSNDRGSLSGDKKLLEPWGRGERFVKILGEGIYLDELEMKFKKFLQARALPQTIVLQDISDNRRGAFLVIASSEPLPASALSDWNETVLPVERVDRVVKVDQIPKTSLGKINYSQLRKKLFVV